MKINIFEKMTSQDVFWSLLGRFGRQKASKREAKRDPRGSKNETKMTSQFRSIFGSILDHVWRPSPEKSAGGGAGKRGKAGGGVNGIDRSQLVCV